MKPCDITNADLIVLEQAARAASSSPWSLGVSPTNTVEEAANYIADSARQAGGSQVWFVVIGKWPEGTMGPERAKIPAYTGNGPTSEANARYLVCVQPSNVLALINALRQARAEARQARERLDRHKLLTPAQLEQLGTLADSSDSYAQTADLPMPAWQHVEQLQRGLRDMAGKLKALYQAVSDDDPWSEAA